MRRPQGFSVVILTLNEERDLPRALQSVSTCDDIVVLDSGSTDRTAEIARKAGARVLVRPFDTFAGQRNYAQKNVAFRHPWVFHLDADEQFTPELEQECRSISGRDDLDGCHVAPRMLWMGRWIPHCTDFPAYQARFVRAPQFEFIDVGHGQREAPHMRMHRVEANYLHDLSSGGVSEWIERHRRYARAEARHHVADTTQFNLKDLTSGDSLLRRRAFKKLSYLLPFRPTARFVYQYLLRGGFLDGKQGFEYCRLLARYEGFAAEEIAKLRKSAP